MSSRDKDQTTPHHQPLLSSLVVRPSVGDGGGDGGGRREYEPGEVRRDPPPAYRSDRYSDEPALNVACKNLGLEEGIMVFYRSFLPGYRTRVGSVSPVRRRDVDHRYSSNFDHSRGMPHSHKFGSGRDHGRYGDPSPPYAQGRGGGRSFGRDFGGPALGPGPLRGEGMNRNNPNVRPREGDWTCPDPSCGNLNFARREYCNNCKRFRYAPVGSPRRGYSGPPPPPPPAPPSRRFSGPPMDISSDRPMNGFRSPPRGWGMSGHGPREFGAGGPPPSRHEGRFSDHMRRDRLDLPDYGYRGRNKPMPPMDWSHRDRGRDNFNERKGYDRRAPSPPPAALVPPHRGRWGQDMRERSRSPIRGAPPPKGYHQDMYMERGRNDGRGVRRDGIRNAY